MIKWEDYQEKTFPRNKITSYGNINYGVICGKTSNNLLIIDLDYKNNNSNHFERIYDKFLVDFPDLSNTLICKTPHGHHLYYYLDKPYPRKMNQDTKKKAILKLLNKGKRNPTMIKATNFPESLSGVDFLGGGYAVIPPSGYNGLKYRTINDNTILKIDQKALADILKFFLKDKPTKQQLRQPFFDLLTGKRDIKEISSITGMPEHVYWKYVYLEAYHRLDLLPEDIIPLLEKNQPEFELKKTELQLEHLNLSNKPMTSNKMVDYFPNFKPKTKNKSASEPLYITIAKHLMEKYEFITMEDTDEIYVKRGNIHTKKLGAFKNDLAKEIEFHGKNITYLSGNIFKYIKYTTQFDRKNFCYDHWIINFKNGYLNIIEDKFYSNDEYKDKLFCYEIPHNYNPDSEKECPEFIKLLNDWLPKNKNITPDDIFEMMGYTMTMNTDMKMAFFIHGPSHTGKTQFQTILEHIIGHQNRAAIPLQRLDKNEFGSDGLEFKILNMVGDMSDLSPKDTSTFKTLTGGDKWVGAEYKGGAKYEFRNVMKIWYNGNKLQRLEKDDNVFYGRWTLVPFLNVFEMYDENTIKNIGETICSNPDEVEGIINESVVGLKRLLERNYFRYKLMKNTKHVWRYDAEPLYAFIYDNCKFKGSDGIICSDFKRKYNKFLYKKGTRSVSSNALRDQLEKFGVYKERHGTGNGREYFFQGFRWKTEDDESETKWNKRFFN